MNYSNARDQIFASIQKAVADELIRASAGNFSMRTEDGNIAITPAGIGYDVLQPEEIAIVDLDGNHIDGPCRASSEIPMHTAIMRHLPHVGAICHTHSIFAMTFAILGQEIPMVNLELLVCGAPIPVAPWACPGSTAAGEVTVETFKQRPQLKAMLLRNHGLVSIGKNVNDAYKYAYDAEVGAQVYHQALQVGTPVVLTKAQIQEVYDVYGSYPVPNNVLTRSV